MLTRLKSWIQGSRQKKREEWAADHGNLSKEDKQAADEYSSYGPDPMYQTRGYDETSRGRPKT
jgi:hypothetical protein